VHPRERTPLIAPARVKSAAVEGDLLRTFDRHTQRCPGATRLIAPSAACSATAPRVSALPRK